MGSSRDNPSMRAAMLARSCPCLLALLLVVSCAPAPTQLIVVVDTDLRIPDDLDRVTVSVTVDGDVIESEQARPTAAALPLTLSVIRRRRSASGPSSSRRAATTGHACS